MDVDTSSYPKPAAAAPNKTLLDTAQQFGNIEQQNISISQAKLKQVNDQFQLMNAELSNLAEGNPTKQEAAVRLTRFSQTYGFKPEVTNHMLAELNEAPDVKVFAENALRRGQGVQEKINSIYGGYNETDTGQTIVPNQFSPMKGFTRQYPPIQKQIPPTQPVIGSDGQPTFQGPTPAITPPGTVAVPSNRLPFAVTPPSNFRSGVSAASPNQVVQDRMPNGYPAPTGPASGQSPLFAQGLQEYSKDLSDASGRAVALKNLTQALPLINSKGFLSGPGTESFTRGVAALKTWGLLDIADNADPTAIRQEVNKKLANYISNSPIGQRSDAQQSLKEAASPSAKVQILPALKQLVKDAVALERVQIAMPNAFEGKDYQNYVKHKGTFPQSVDEKAFALDQEDDGGKKTVDEMAGRLKKNKNDAKAIKFFRSLEIADKQGFYK